MTTKSRALEGLASLVPRKKLDICRVLQASVEAILIKTADCKAIYETLH